MFPFRLGTELRTRNTLFFHYSMLHEVRPVRISNVSLGEQEVKSAIVISRHRRSCTFQAYKEMFLMRDSQRRCGLKATKAF